MTVTRSALFAAVAAVSMTTLAAPASAQQDAKRDAAIRKCVQAIQQILGTGEEEMARRVAAWRACMTAEGERP